MEVKKILFTSILFFILMDSCASAGEVPDYTMKINFSNVTGSTIIDEAGGASGTLFNVARTQLPSGAFYGTFGGNSSSYVDLTNREDLDFGSNFTIEAWIRPEIPNEHGAILAKGSGQAGYQYMLSDTGNICAPFANFTNSGWVYCGSQSSLDNNSWYQVVWTVETNNTEGFPQHNRAYIYVNMDRSLPTTTDGQILGSNSYNAYLGKGGYGNYKGDILILRVYRRMLSPAEIYQNYVATAPLVMPEVKIENSSYMFENGAGSQNINITLDSEAVNTVSYVDVRTFDGTANSSDYNTDNNSNSGLIAAIGDSITEASDVYYNNAHGYVGYLSQNLSAADNWTIINYGVGGYTTNNILSEYYSYVQPYHPSYGILLIGTNDIFRDVKSATYVENNIETIVGRMVEDNVTPILTTIPPSNTRTIETNNTMTTVNAWIRDYAAINGYHYVDLYALLADPNNPDLMMDDMTTDGLHLSALGCEVWSSAINPEWFKNDRRRVYFFPGDTLATFNTEILNNPESGNKTFKVDLFTPSGVYFSGVQESSVTIVDPVQNTTPSITWNSPADITYGTALSSTQLDAVATDPVTGNNVPGNLVYTPPAGTLLDVGTHTLHVDFTPDNSANYTTASKDVIINVIDQATPSGEVPGYTMMINFSNVTGSTIIDEAGGASGTLFNVARTQLPSGAYYGTFGGNSSSYVDLTNREDLDFGSNFTIEAWIRPDIPNGYGAIMAKGSGQAGYQYMLSDTGNICTPYANFTNSGWVYCGSQSILDNNSWYQVVWTVETNSTEGFPQHNRAYIYVNMDRSLPSTTNGQIVGSSSYNAYLGKGGYGNYKGDILFVRVYRKMLSPAEIYQNYVATAPLVMPEVKIENSSYMFENGAGSQNINITLDGEAVNTVSYVDVRAFGGTANSSDYNTDNNSNSGLIAAIGDSITEGSNVYYNNAHGYVGYLSQNLSAVDNWTIINYGVGGYTTDNVLSEYNSYVHPYHPSYGILLIGTNDIFRDVKSATYVENNIEIIVGRMVEDNVTPILTTIPPSSTSTVETNSTLTAVNAWIRNYAATNGYYCVDLYSLLADPIDPSTMKADMTTDGIHLSQLGYQVWSNAINPEWFKNDRRRVYFFPGDTLATFNTEILNNPGSGNKTFKVDLFTPSGVYFPGVQESTITINESKAIPLITWDNPANITYGTTLSSTQLNAVATDPVTGNNVPGNFVYTPYAGTLLGVGTHTLQVDFTPDDSANYTTASKTVTINVSKTAPIITWSTPANITYGTALNSSQLNAVASVSGTFVYTPSAGTVLDVGTHTLHVDFTPADTINYTTATADVTINVSERTKATPEITWSDPADITYGTALNEAQLNALASVPGSFVYSPAYGTILGAGTQTLQTTFTPADSVNYTTATGSVSLTVNKATPLITWSNPDAISYGTALSSTQLNAVASVPGSFVYSPASGTVLSAGTHDLQANFTPADAANYTTALKTVTINVSKTDPIITWSNPDDITYGTALSDTQLNAVASVPGTFVYTPSAGTVLNSGIQTLSINFTPADSANYTTASKSVTINISKAIPSITWSNPANVAYGTALSGTQLNAVSSVPGSFVYNPASGTVLGAGTQTLQTTFTPADSANYTTASKTVTISISKTLPSITWSSPADITYGTALNEAQLNALASVPGSFVYSPAYGTILGAGTQTLQTTFTPADSVNYTTATGSVSLTVNKATPLITWSNPDAISYGTALSSTQLNAVASVPGSFVYSPASGTVLSAGTHDLQANFTPTDAANYTNITAIVTINVLSQPILPVADFNASVFSGYAPLSVLFTDRSQNTTSWSWDFGDGATSVKQNPKHVYSSAGIYTVRLTAVNANGTDLKTATITVDKKTRGKSSNSNNNGGSPEFAKNIEVKELSQAFIVKGKTVQFDFTKNATCVVYVGFDAKKTVSGKTATIAEQLKNKSTLVSGLPGGEVYNYFNVWVGNSEFATSNNIENPVLCFKVEKSWIQDKNIDRDSIILNRYSNRAWEKLSTSFSGEDDKYLYFESNVPGYSFFAITWKSDAFLEETVIDIQPGDSSEENKKETGSEIDLESNEKKESPGMPGFDMVYGIAGLLVVLLYKKIKVY